MQQVLRGRSRRCLLLQPHLLHACGSRTRCCCRLACRRCCRLFVCRRRHWLYYRQVIAKAETLQQELAAVGGKVGLQKGPGLGLLAALQLQPKAPFQAGRDAAFKILGEIRTSTGDAVGKAVGDTNVCS